ncbi:complex I NDUFA9 subunit family protein [Alkalicaulis satelles]|uniref:Complex I NDUFA9 subunit family protein n=1 Tax=Alkalicaulis satelles TaxID=2609175 RepID=A0A5M6ZJ70_9PROT|nr:complex I NDUFA9 subunit family protein [Alkalicaulis satelles]KAA5804055.1 complex I NDUFA9 subunit family protein [Alkalicaulis satelles]
MTILRDEMITVFGASGFIGRYVVRRLAKAGYRVRAATRRPHLAHELKPMGVVGQVQLVQANLRDPASVARAVDGAHGVVNLVGILAEGGRQTFQSLQAEGAGLVARAAREAGVERFVHISAIGADAHSKSRYARTKALGEQAVLEAMPGAVILRPSIVFGPEDGFFNRFADMARFAPALPLIGGGATQFQPVYCDDVALCALKALEGEAHRGRVYELGGPKTYTFRELMAFILNTIERPRLLIPVPFPIASMMGLAGEIMGALPFVEPFLTRDQVTLLKSDNVAGAGGADTGRISDFGVSPESIEAVTPAYLARYRKGGQFADKRRLA